jgi:hypothetical protein
MHQSARSAESVAVSLDPSFPERVDQIGQTDKGRVVDRRSTPSGCDHPIEHFQIDEQGAQLGSEGRPGQFGDRGGKGLNIAFQRSFNGRRRTQRRRHVQFNEAPDQPVGPLELRGDQHMDVLRAGLGQQVLHPAQGQCRETSRSAA